METTVLSPQSPPLWSAGQNFQETLAQAEKIAARNQQCEDGTTHAPPPRQLLQYLVR